MTYVWSGALHMPMVTWRRIMVAGGVPECEWRGCTGWLNFDVGAPVDSGVTDNPVSNTFVVRRHLAA